MVTLQEHLSRIGLCTSVYNSLVKIASENSTNIFIDETRQSLNFPYIKTVKSPVKGQPHLLKLRIGDEELTFTELTGYVLFGYRKKLAYDKERNEVKRRFIRPEQLEEWEKSYTIVETQDLVIFNPEEEIICIYEGWKTKTNQIKHFTKVAQEKKLSVPDIFVVIKPELQKNEKGQEFVVPVFSQIEKAELPEECRKDVELIKAHFMWRKGLNKTSPLIPNIELIEDKEIVPSEEPIDDEEEIVF